MDSKIYVYCFEGNKLGGNELSGSYITSSFSRINFDDEFKCVPSESSNSIQGLAKTIARLFRNDALTVINDTYIEEAPDLCTHQEEHFRVGEGRMAWYRKLSKEEFKELKEILNKELAGGPFGVPA